jgi:hypothetical protein
MTLLRSHGDAACESPFRCDVKDGNLELVINPNEMDGTASPK